MGKQKHQMEEYLGYMFELLVASSTCCIFLVYQSVCVGSAQPVQQQRPSYDFLTFIKAQNLLLLGHSTSLTFSFLVLSPKKSTYLKWAVTMLALDMGGQILPQMLDWNHQDLHFSVISSTFCNERNLNFIPYPLCQQKIKNKKNLNFSGTLQI